MTAQTVDPQDPNPLDPAALAALAAQVATPGGTVSQLPTQPGGATHPPTPYPLFEGAVVEGVVIQISGVKGMDIGAVLTTDDIVRMAGVYKCIGVQHKPDKDGNLIRYQTLVPRELDVIPFDPSDPDDDGIVRSRQIPGWSSK